MSNPTSAVEPAVAVFGGGCFWCLEAVFELQPGVVSVENGYAGGKRPNPSYEQVCSGATGHIEVVRIQFDNQKTDYASLLDIFFRCHDPCSRDRQGADEGSQYRSVVFWVDQAQKDLVAQKIAAWEKRLGRPIVTESRPLADNPFWVAEAYHQHYFRNHPEQAYCRLVIRPKVEHFLGAK